MALTREQKDTLAGAVISHVATLLDNWEENTTIGYQQECAGIPYADAAQQVANWLARLPGGSWDSRLPDPRPR